jgi:flagellin-like hook-associated protein FlgL
MTQQSDGMASTEPAISAATPVSLGGLFDPTTATAIGPFAPTLKNAATLSTTIRVPAGALANANIAANTTWRPENVTTRPNTLGQTSQTVRLAGNFNNNPTAVSGVGAEAIPPTIQLPLPAQNNRFDISLTGDNAITDSTGRRLNALLRVQYEGGANPGWRTYLVSARDSNGTELLAAPAKLGQRTGGTATTGGIAYTDGIINPADAQGTAGRPIVLRPTAAIAITGGNLNPQIEFTANSFTSSASATSLVASGDQPFGTLGAGNPPATPSLAQTLSDPTYYLKNFAQDDKRAGEISVRISDDQFIPIGVRADDPAFEPLARVLNYARQQGVPLSQADLAAALTLIDQSIAGLDTLRANAAFDQLQMRDARAFHQTTINLAKNTDDQILTADPAETVAKLQSLQTTIEASYATIAQIRQLSLVNYL